MKHVFTYCIVRYAPDPGAGEALNVGVVLHTEEGRTSWRFDHRYRRLSEAFAGFNGTVYRQSIGRVEEALRAASDSADRALIGSRRYTSAIDVLGVAICDQGLCLSVSEARGGVTNDTQAELGFIFERMVESRAPERTENQRRSDDQVWRHVFAPKIPPDVMNQLRPKKFTTSDTEVEFEHAYKNGRWHVVQPISLDYKGADTIQKRATQWAGTSLGLEGERELGTIYFLLGAPKDQRLQKSYERARNLLSKAPVAHEVIEEHEADRFAETLTDLVRHAEHD